MNFMHGLHAAKTIEERKVNGMRRNKKWPFLPQGKLTATVCIFFCCRDFF